MSSKLEKFKDVLREIFQMDQADLDFGIYRIMNQKRDEIEKFLDQDLLPQVKSLIETYHHEDISSVKEELDKAIENARSIGIEPNSVPKVRELQEKYSTQADTSSLEDEVFSHLTNFFRRYYDNGDFISLRRYKKDVYAIPYEGEEVKLYWANKDQYYIKTSEYFNNYSFKLNDGKKVHLIIEEAATEQNNNLTSNGKERRFFIKEDEPVSIQDGELFIKFHYDVNDGKQKDLNRTSYEKIKSALPHVRNENIKGIDFNGIYDLKPTVKNPNRTLIEKHINDYTARNTFDYFIHKDLGGFLRRELDFYIKNEVLYIDDINELDEKQFHKQISTIKVIKEIGHKVITFLEQLENFQKKLWLKKKFVVETNYCITLDRVPRELYSQIISNDEQIKEWKKLFAIEDIQGDLTIEAYSDPLTEKFLEENQFLVLDTKFFNDDFLTKLLKSIHNLDEQTNGLLIHSENFQALNLIVKRYSEAIKCIYIDPPYNAKSSKILYKNNFMNSSWLSLMENRILTSKFILTNNAVFIIAIDENEQENLGKMLDNNFPDWQKTCITIISNPSGQQSDNFSYTSEYCYFIYPRGKRIIAEEQREGNADIRNFRDVTGDESLRTAARNCFYPILVKDGQIFGFGPVSDDEYHPGSPNVVKDDGIIEVYPIDPQNIERKWRFARQTVESIKDELTVQLIRGRNIWDIKREKNKFNYKTVWTDSKYSANNHGTQLLNHILGAQLFSYPKSIFTVYDSIYAGLTNESEGIVLDYFAGSGTTGQAVINMNRNDNGKRKYILVEMGEYFDPVTKPRIEKIIYSKDWRDGKPISREGISHCFKYFTLESYEDTLNNLELSKDQSQQQILEMNDQFREGYMLSYMLDVETDGSMSLLNVDKFEDPFNYYLNITRNNEITKTKVDLIETFNYLIGLIVETIDTLDNYKVITGHNLSDEKILIIWRNLKNKSNENLNNFFGRIRVNIRDSEFDRIYLNGDNYLENMKIAEEKWKVVLIEEEFKKRMFENFEL